jgi:hypothetical protein
MIGDYMTKPLQGGLFTKFRDQIMGVVANDKGKSKETKSKDLASKKGLVQHVEKASKLHHRSVLEKKVNPVMSDLNPGRGKPGRGTKKDTSG